MNKTIKLRVWWSSFAQEWVMKQWCTDSNPTAMGLGDTAFWTIHDATNEAHSLCKTGVRSHYLVTPTRGTPETYAEWVRPRELPESPGLDTKKCFIIPTPDGPEEYCIHRQFTSTGRQLGPVLTYCDTLEEAEQVCETMEKR